MGWGGVDDDPGPFEVLDRLAVQRVGGVGIGEQGTGEGERAERPLRPDGQRALLEPRQRRSRLVDRALRAAASISSTAKPATSRSSNSQAWRAFVRASA